MSEDTSRLHADAVSTLESLLPTTGEQDSLRNAFLGFLEARADACSRSCTPGHITASALVVDTAARNTLLTLHPRVGAWLQLGGHCEPEDETLCEAALREAREESGIADLVISDEPVHIAVHPVTCSLGVPTRHFDVRYLVHAPDGAEPVRSDESEDLRWWPVEQLPGTEVAALLGAARSSVWW